MEIAAYICGALTVVAGIVAALALGLHHRDLSIWTSCAAIVFVVLGVFCWVQDRQWKNDARLNPTPNALDTSSWTALSAQTASPTIPSSALRPSPAIITPVPLAPLTPTPPSEPTTASTPTPKVILPSPEDRMNFLSLDDVLAKLLRAIKSSNSGEYNEVRNALNGVQVDWTLNFHSANRDEKSMHVWLDNTKLGLVHFDLPLAGNEKLPLMEKTDVFRVRGIIDEAQLIAIRLREAKMEYVPSDPKK